MAFFLLALQMLPGIITAVQQLHGPKPGSSKKAMVLNAIVSAASAVGTTLTSQQVAQLGVHADETVTALKAGGVIQKQ